MTNVREKMTTDLTICAGDATLADAARLMRDQDLGNVLVKIDDELGIVTDRDIVVRAIAEGMTPETTQLATVATRNLQVVSPDDDLDEVVSTMRAADVRRVPVCEDGDPVGILSIGDMAQLRDEGSALADISDAAPNN